MYYDEGNQLLDRNNSLSSIRWRKRARERRVFVFGLPFSSILSPLLRRGERKLDLNAVLPRFCVAHRSRVRSDCSTFRIRPRLGLRCAIMLYAIRTSLGGSPGTSPDRTAARCSSVPHPL